MAILLVDDELLLLEAVSKSLGRYYTVYTAADGKEALDVLDAHPEITGVFTDWEMPKMDGLELLRAINERYPHVAKRALATGKMLTEEQKAELQIRLSALGAAFFTKPYPPSKMKSFFSDSA